MITGDMATAPPATSRVTMAEAIDRLRLIQWLSPAFPIGGFAYSQGLETAITEGQVRTAADVESWISAILHHGSGSSDAILLAHARAPDADLMALGDLCLALAASAERQTETVEQGRAFSALISGMGAAQPSLPYPIAVGVATRALSLQTVEILALWLHGLAAQLVSAAVRFVPLGQTQGQTILANLAPQITALADIAARASLAEIATSTFGADLAAMRHETLPVRIFRT